MCSSLNRNNIEFYFDFVFDLNGSARDAYGIYAEVALFERCRTEVVSPPLKKPAQQLVDSFRAGSDSRAPPNERPQFWLLRMMLQLRSVGFGWKEIGAILKTTDCAARAEFSREVNLLIFGRIDP
jgi:hypothetical protein